jgi:hypothetical protein
MSQLSQALGKKFKFTVENKNAEDKAIALLPGFFNTDRLHMVEGAPNTGYILKDSGIEITSAGYAVDSVVDDKNSALADAVYNNIICTPGNPQFSIRSFREFVKEQPLVLQGMTIQRLNDVSVFDQTIRIIEASAIEKIGEDFLSLQDYYSPNQYDSTKIVMEKLGLLLNFQTLMIMTIPAGAKVAYSFNF